MTIAECGTGVKRAASVGYAALIAKERYRYHKNLTTGGTMSQTGQLNLQTARIIAGALAGGVFGFWTIAWVVTGGGKEGLSPDAIDAGLAYWIGIGAMALAFLGALFIRNRSLRLVEESARFGARMTSASGSPETADGPRIGSQDRGADLERTVQTYLVIAWSILETGALLCGVFALLLGLEELLYQAAPIYFVGFLLTFPRGEWYPGRAEASDG